MAQASRENEATPSLRDTKLRLMQAHLAEKALRLMIERGFEAVTVEELASAAGISRRTFFRYFPSKEDVVIRVFDEPGQALLAEFARRLHTETPIVALRASFDAILEAFGDDPIGAQATLHMVWHTPTLRGRFLVTQDDWIKELVRLIKMHHEGEEHAPMIAELTARVAVAAIDTALVAWGERPEADLREIAKETFDALVQVVGEGR